MPRALLIEWTDYRNYPVGGQTSFMRTMMGAFGNQLALVGLSTGDDPVGTWTKKTFDGVTYDFLGLDRVLAKPRKPLIPSRITFYRRLRKHKDVIRSFGVKAAFIQGAEALIAASGWGWKHLCYRFPGVACPLRNGRYLWGKPFAPVFDRMLFSALEKTDLILACADNRAIDGLIARSGGRLQRSRIIQYATRVDTNVFHLVPRDSARQALGIGQGEMVVVTCGRINKYKGWDLVLGAFECFSRRHENARLYYVGDGEDVEKLAAAVRERGLASKVKVTGFQPPAQVNLYYGAANVCVVGSHFEGRSVAMLEALACGRPIASTDVSGAREMIVEGHNGFIIDGREPEALAAAMERALRLPDPASVSLRLVEQYALENLPKNLGAMWPPLAN